MTNRRVCGVSPGHQQRNCFDREAGNGMPRREHNEEKDCTIVQPFSFLQPASPHEDSKKPPGFSGGFSLAMIALKGLALGRRRRPLPCRLIYLIFQ